MDATRWISERHNLRCSRQLRRTILRVHRAGQLAAERKARLALEAELKKLKDASP